MKIFLLTMKTKGATKQIFLDVGEEKEINETNVTDYINGFLKEKGLGLNNLRGKVNKPVREELVKLLLQKSNLSKRGIALALGLNREMVRKAAVSKEPSP